MQKVVLELELELEGERVQELREQEMALEPQLEDWEQELESMKVWAREPHQELRVPELWCRQLAWLSVRRVIG